MQLNHLDLFAGIGGFTLGFEWASTPERSFKPLAFCEIEEFPQKVLRKNWPNVPIYPDVRELTADRIVSDGLPLPDIITGGFPCQDLSAAGKQDGLGPSTRSGLFREIIRLALECGEHGIKPYIVFENVGRFLSGPTESPGRWFGEFLHALAEIGYDAEWNCITAASIGAPHERDRVWIVAYPHEAQREGGGISRRIHAQHSKLGNPRWGKDKPGVVRALNGVPDQSHRLAALGNAILPQIAQIIGSAILEDHAQSLTPPQPT